MKGKYLITTDNWFVAPDGKSYRINLICLLMMVVRS